MPDVIESAASSPDSQDNREEMAAPPNLREQDWLVLLNAIARGKCTPFLGAGACHGFIPLGAELAQEWASAYSYPLDDHRDLARVAQFVATEYDPLFLKDKVSQRLKEASPPDFQEHDEPHGVLADLPLPVYITTNYDDFMVRALESRNRKPRREICRWNQLLIRHQKSLFKPGFKLNVANPVVFHLHGCSEVSESLVLTEDDYIDFLVNIGKGKMMPERIEESFANASLLFLGYSLADWDFRVLFRSLSGYIERSTARAHISVQLVPVGAQATAAQKARAQSYLDRYFRPFSISIYWGTCRQFVRELGTRWRAHGYANNS